MMDFFTSGSIASALAPKVEVGQEALYDALRARDETRALRIIKRVSSAARDGAGSRRNDPRIPEVREHIFKGLIGITGCNSSSSTNTTP